MGSGPERRALRHLFTVVIVIAGGLLLSACQTQPPPTTDIGRTGTPNVVGDVMTRVAGSAAPDMPGGIRTQPPVISTPSGDPSESGEGDLWAVYFTDPVIPFDDVTTGGIEDNLIWLIDHAQYTIDAAVFEFGLQNVADALIRAHNRGVQVRMVHDDEHTAEDAEMAQVIAAGIPATPDRRDAYMHNKFFVFDGSIVWTGSTNITVNGMYRNNNNAIAIVSDELAANYTAEFEEMFNGAFGPTSPYNTPYPGTPLGDSIWVETYFSPEDLTRDQIVSVVSEAQHSVHFMAFAFTSDEIGQAMMDRADAGVEIAGIFETRGANTQYSECPRLLNHGVDVRLDGNPRTMHHKVVIVDGAIVVTGSFNFSSNATNNNDENILIIHSPYVAARYEEEFNRRMAEAQWPAGGECLSGAD